nr:MAG TPA: stabilization protein [Caudoviricetes sp.]
MEVAYYNLAGGINQALTKTELGLDTKRIYWADAENVEILQNRGIVKQKGNSLFLDIGEKITGLFEMSAYDLSKLVITTVSGKIYVYDELHSKKILVNKTLSGVKPVFLNFLNGILIMTESDGLFYLKNNSTYDVVECELKTLAGETLTSGVMSIYKGRVWVAKDATIYYSALGTYNDFTTQGDAGYINEFHTDTGAITALKPYKDYLAVYKKDSVYLLTGSSSDDFAINLFANKGAVGANSILNVDNKQYFLSNGIFALEQVGELNQIQLGGEISQKIKDEFSRFEKLENSIALHYEAKNQIWYFFPYVSDKFFHMIWINDYENKAWYKRKIPQNIVTACIYNAKIYTADKDGKIYKEDFGTSFAGKPIDFLWKTPFLAITKPHHRKMIDEFYFLLDTEYDNDFNFSVYKDYDSGLSDDAEHIYSVYQDHLIWADEKTNENLPCYWARDDETIPVWPVNKDALEKAEISEANYAVQLCVEGSEQTNSCAIIGLQFREVYIDD